MEKYINQNRSNKTHNPISDMKYNNTNNNKNNKLINKNQQI